MDSIRFLIKKIIVKFVYEYVLISILGLSVVGFLSLLGLQVIDHLPI